MSYAENWFALATRIKSLQNAGELYSRFQSYQEEDLYGAGRYLREQCGDVVESLESFSRDFSGSLPCEAKKRLDDFLRTKFVTAAKDDKSDNQGARGALVALAALEAEITFILSGRQEQIRARSERALISSGFLLSTRRQGRSGDARLKMARSPASSSARFICFGMEFMRLRSMHQARALIWCSVNAKCRRTSSDGMEEM